MKQPTKDTLRDQLVLAADEIIRLRGAVSVLRYEADHPRTHKLPSELPRWKRALGFLS